MSRTVRLVPNKIYNYDETRFSIENESNMFTNVDSDTYARITGSTSSNGKILVSGFDFSQVPSSAIVTSYSLKIKISSSANVQLSTRDYLYNKTSPIEDASQISINLRTDPYISSIVNPMPWAELVNVGDDLCFGIPGRGNAYTDVYGVEIEVTYDLPVNKVVYGTTVLVDLTADTVTPETLLQGYTAHDKSGALITGTADTNEGSIYQDGDGYLVVDDSESSAPQGNLSITENGTYDVSDYAGAEVSIGGTSWTLLNSIDVQYSTVSSTSSFVTDLVISESYDPTKILWISVRDTQGKRTGYYYGSDCIYLANTPNNSSASQYCLIRSVGSSNGFWQSTSNAAYGGIYPVNPRLSNNDGMTITMQGKYSSTYGTGTIDSTYRISAYYVDYPSELAPIGVGL